VGECVNGRLRSLLLLLLGSLPRLDLAEYPPAIARELSQVADPQAVGRIVVKSEVPLAFPDLLDFAKLG
jgi:hypothetical protein